MDLRHNEHKFPVVLKADEIVEKTYLQILKTYYEVRHFLDPYIFLVSCVALWFCVTKLMKKNAALLLID